MGCRAWLLVAALAGLAAGCSSGGSGVDAGGSASTDTLGDGDGAQQTPAPPFADSALVAAVRAAAPDPAGWDSLTTLAASGRGIVSLEGIAALGGLVTLDLSDNRISDISALASLAHLERLDLSENAVADLGPLRGLLGVRALLLEGNRVADVEPLLGLQRLEVVALTGNPLSAASAAACVDSLRRRGVTVEYPEQPGGEGGGAGQAGDLAGAPGARALAFDAAGVLYAGTCVVVESDTLPAVAVSPDGGTSWAMLSRNLPSPLGRGSVDLLGADAQVPAAIFVHGPLAYAHSEDGGSTWRVLSVDQGVSVCLVPVMVPDVLVGRADPEPWYLLSPNGVQLYRSRNRGIGWLPRLSPVRAMAPAADGELYLGLASDIVLTRGVAADERGGGTVLASCDGAVMALASCPADPGVLYAATERALCLSRDGGASFDTVLTCGAEPWGTVRLRCAADPARAAIITGSVLPADYRLRTGYNGFEALERQLRHTRDGGHTWETVSLPGAVWDAAYSPVAAGALYAATTEGVWRIGP